MVVDGEDTVVQLRDGRLCVPVPITSVATLRRFTARCVRRCRAHLRLRSGSAAVRERLVKILTLPHHLVT